MDGNCSSMIAIGKRIREKREELKLTQEGLGKIIGVSRVVVNYWENGSRDIKTGDIVLLADALGVTTDYLLGRTGDPNQQPCAVDELGLSTKTINFIKKINEGPSLLKGRSRALDFLISSDGFGSLLYNLFEFLKLIDTLGEKNTEFLEYAKNNPDEFYITEYDAVLFCAIDEVDDEILNRREKAEEYERNIRRTINRIGFKLFQLEKTLNHITEDYIKRKLGERIARELR